MNARGRRFQSKTTNPAGQMTSPSSGVAPNHGRRDGRDENQPARSLKIQEKDRCGQRRYDQIHPDVEARHSVSSHWPSGEHQERHRKVEDQAPCGLRLAGGHRMISAKAITSRTALRYSSVKNVADS